MARSSENHRSSIDRIVRGILGSRVKSVETASHINVDGAPILRVRVIYDAKASPSVSEMEDVLDAVWKCGEGDEAPFPVIDFQEDTDVTPIAAE